MRNYLSPGVYFTPPLPAPPDLRLVRTDIAGFVGYCERGPLPPEDASTLEDPSTLAVRINSWAEYRTIFGGLTPFGYLPQAVRAFFENGGTTCYVVRVAASSSKTFSSLPQIASMTIPGGDIAAEATTVVKLSGSNLSVASTTGLAPGTIIGFGDDSLSICGIVASVVDATNLTLASPPSGTVDPSSTVRILTATTLTETANRQDELKVDNVGIFEPGDTVLLTSDGVIEPANIAEIIDGKTIRLTSTLKGTHPAGTYVRKQKAGVGFEATSPGNWGNRLEIDLVPLSPGPGTTRFHLRINLVPGPDLTQPPEAESFFNLSLDENDARSAPDIVNDSKTGSRLVRLNLPPNLTELSVTNGRIFPFPTRLSGGRDGLSGVTVRDFIGGEEDFRGLRVLEEVDEVGILVVPDAVNAGQPVMTPRATPAVDPCKQPAPVAVQALSPDDPTAQPPSMNRDGSTGKIFAAMASQAQRLRYRVAILETPDKLEPKEALAWLKQQEFPQTDVPFAAAYYPWVLVPDGLDDDLSTCRIPPSGHVAGVYAQVDNKLGVQHPPANVALEFAVDLGKHMTDSQQGLLNEGGLNVLRSFPGRGLRVWGARSVAAVDDDLPEWWFIHARRTLSMIENTVEKSMQWTVFEVNDDNLRRTLSHSLYVLLEKLWLDGGLKGVSPSEAFYIKCDDTNNPQSGIDLGQLVCEVGVAIAAPMEFLVFQICRVPGGSEVVEG